MAQVGAISEAEYVHGYDATVLQSHLWRTVDNSCTYLLPYIRPSMKILDVGCGPGNLTCDIAQRVPNGSVTGIDVSEDVIGYARKIATERQSSNVSFCTGNVFSMEFQDRQFDMVHAHQVLQHVGDASRALKEMRRVTKPGGIIAVRDVAYFLYWPECAEIELFNELFFKIGRATGGIPGSGRMLRQIFREAEFNENHVSVGAGTWCFASRNDLDFWCGMWKKRVLKSGFAENALKLGFASQQDLERISEAWGRFSSTKDAWFTVVHGEVIYKREDIHDN
ncbi:putative ubiE/COQ5 methyltransferase [Trichoderma evansii]